MDIEILIPRHPWTRDREAVEGCIYMTAFQLFGECEVTIAWDTTLNAGLGISYRGCGNPDREAHDKLWRAAYRVVSQIPDPNYWVR